MNIDEYEVSISKSGSLPGNVASELNKQLSVRSKNTNESCRIPIIDLNSLVK